MSSKFISLKKLLRLVILAFLIILGTYIGIRPNTNTIVESEPLEVKNGNIDINGTWLILDNKQHNDDIKRLTKQTIVIDNNQIIIGNRYCQRLSIEKSKADSYLERFGLRGDINNNAEALYWTTNCNNAGNPFVKSEGPQGLVILDKRYVFLLYLGGQEQHLLQLLKSLK